MRNLTTAFPLLCLPLFLYAFLAYTIGSDWTTSVAATPTMSGTAWTITIGDVFTWGSIALLFVEIVKATATNSRAIMNHALSIIVFIAGFALFVTNGTFVNSVFFTFVLFTLVDTVAGFVITIISARRDFDGSSGGHVGVLH